MLSGFRTKNWSGQQRGKSLEEIKATPYTPEAYHQVVKGINRARSGGKNE